MGPDAAGRVLPRFAAEAPALLTEAMSFALVACMVDEEAERRISLPLERGPPVSVPDALSAEEAATDRLDAPQPRVAMAELGRAPPPAIDGEGWEWSNLERSGLRDGSVPVNADGA